MLSPPSRGAWIEIRGLLANYAGALSPPSRGAWIEIVMTCNTETAEVVAPLAGGVD